MNTSVAPGNIPNHMVWAIVSTVLGLCLCCPALGTGIVAIVFASKVNNLLNQGDIDGARQASNNAKTWCMVTTGLAVLGLIINIVYFSMGGFASYMEAMQQMQQMR
ncbi:MAG: CD225/dispanin family protein [Lysobacteraceae bacterium]|nr:MAG: CD225/dispanin family protein [Xanthomonadaceae bacterium]